MYYRSRTSRVVTLAAPDPGADWPDLRPSDNASALMAALPPSTGDGWIGERCKPRNGHAVTCVTLSKSWARQEPRESERHARGRMLAVYWRKSGTTHYDEPDNRTPRAVRSSRSSTGDPCEALRAVLPGTFRWIVFQPTALPRA